MITLAYCNVDNLDLKEAYRLLPENRREKVDYYVQKFDKSPELDFLYEIANIISWNIFQMDGLKFVVPYSCKNGKTIVTTLFGEEEQEIECIGCKKNQINNHNGIYCEIKDWKTGKKIKFKNLINKG